MVRKIVGRFCESLLLRLRARRLPWLIVSKEGGRRVFVQRDHQMLRLGKGH